MQEYMNIKMNLADIRNLMVFGGNTEGMMLLLSLARFNLGFVPKSEQKRFLEKEILELEQGLKLTPFIMVPFIPAACRGDEGLMKRYRRSRNCL